jgi:hypothetical protein
MDDGNRTETVSPTPRRKRAEVEEEYGTAGVFVIGVSREIDAPAGFRVGWLSGTDGGFVDRRNATEDERAHVARLNELFSELGYRKLSWRNAKATVKEYARRRGELMIVETDEVFVEPPEVDPTAEPTVDEIDAAHREGVL